MDFEEIVNAYSGVDFEGMQIRPFLLGLLSAFDNRYQACADSFFEEITWKQFFAIICINLCDENPTLNQLAEIMGSSHQNVKQILLKLEKIGFVELVKDEKDKRKQRVFITERCMEFCKIHEKESEDIIQRIFGGISDEDILTTIRTIMRMERNVHEI